MANQTIVDRVASGLSRLRNLELLIDATLHRADPTTLDAAGEPIETDVSLEVFIYGVTEIGVASDKTDPATRFKVLLLDSTVLVTEHDSITWGGVRHKVLRVDGVVAEDDGTRYASLIDTN